MSGNSCIIVEQSPGLQGEITLEGAKNSVLVIMASSVLASGVTTLTNVPVLADVFQMKQLLEALGAVVTFDQQAKTIIIDTTVLNNCVVGPELMRKMRASILVAGPLLARFGRAQVALPGGCVLGARPIDLHLRAFARMGVTIEVIGEYLYMHGEPLIAQRFVLEYPSVGATENMLMAATLTEGTTYIINAAIEPEVLDLVAILRKMGAIIEIAVPGTLIIHGVSSLRAVEHAIIPDRLEAGTLLLAAAVTKGHISIPDCPHGMMDVFLERLSAMGHEIVLHSAEKGVTLKATDTPRSVSFRTGPYPGFPTDLQAPMMVGQCLASGTSIIYETVYENRLVHTRELQKMGAQITQDGPLIATVKGVDCLYGGSVIAPDIRASAALIIAGLAAEGKTIMTGIHHFRRGYTRLEDKLAAIGAKITVVE